MNERRLALSITPRGNLKPIFWDEAAEVEPPLIQRLQSAFAKGVGFGLLSLAAEMSTALPPALAYWRDFAGLYVTAVCTRSDPNRWEGEPSEGEKRKLEALVASAPLIPGEEYLNIQVLEGLWARLHATFKEELQKAGGDVQAFLRSLSPVWNVVGRVHFNLAENRKDEEAPFAFLATYTAGVSQAGRAQHRPLAQALKDYAGEANREGLLSLLLPVQRAAESCGWLKSMVEKGEIFHPLRWTPQEAYCLLRDVPELERAGVIVRMPAAWRAGRPPRPLVRAQVGSRPPSGIGLEALLDFRMEVSLEGEPLSKEELRALLDTTEGLVLIRGQWVEVNGQKLAQAMERLRQAEKLALEQELTFAQAMRLLAGIPSWEEDTEQADRQWLHVSAGAWLADVLKNLRSPQGLALADPGPALKGILRPYQKAGLQWLHLLSQMGLGACLADDMGLGKTIQVISLILVLKAHSKAEGKPSLLVAPASLLANWEAEIKRFAPTLKWLIAHPSGRSPDELRALTQEQLKGFDLVITSYGYLARLAWLKSTSWNLVILDEAQAIKNPGTKQTRAAKKLKGKARIALTGTPVENRLGDLWSIFDFINPGLLGSEKEFGRYAKRLAESRGNPYGPLRELVRPYILRRLKTDRSVISDLPEKVEMKAFCHLSRRQAALYEEGVQELAKQLENSDGIRRKGIVLSFLTRFKQICNHPSHWLGDGKWAEKDSGKLERLRELCEVIAAKQEKVLVFTQFREMTGPLASFLTTVFGRPGLVLHGQTEVGKRKKLVDRFQEDETVDFFVLSLKAGGSGLNLTGASHVIHFDRWWNPAVEDQATDRAFRIGQQRNVVVHKFICRGTIEEKIDELIESKKALSRELLSGTAELNLTEMEDEELLRLVALDIRSAMKG
ncbi:MAG: DEAD/DEAH box helicase [bacterium]